MSKRTSPVVGGNYRSTASHGRGKPKKQTRKWPVCKGETRGPRYLLWWGDKAVWAGKEGDGRLKGGHRGLHWGETHNLGTRGSKNICLLEARAEWVRRGNTSDLKFPQGSRRSMRSWGRRTLVLAPKGGEILILCQIGVRTTQLHLEAENKVGQRKFVRASALSTILTWEKDGSEKGQLGNGQKNRMGESNTKPGGTKMWAVGQGTSKNLP